LRAVTDNAVTDNAVTDKRRVTPQSKAIVCEI
jgi:hypothetical protein